MENHQIMMKQNLGFFEILSESLKIPFKTKKFIFLTFLTSLPLFYSILVHETIFQNSLIQTFKESKSLRLSIHDHGICMYVLNPLDAPLLAFFRFRVVGLLYLGTVHLLDLINTAVIVDSGSKIYGGEKPINFKEILLRPIKGIFITSLYALVMASLSLLGLSSMALQSFISYCSGEANTIYGVFLGVLFLVLSWKYMEWSAIWNMGIVISILDDQKRGEVAFILAAHFSRENRRRGAFLNAVFFVWKVALRLLCLHFGLINGGSRMMDIAIDACLVCFGNVMKWVAFMVYFYDCKKRCLEKKVDVEDGRRAGGDGRRAGESGA